jgi:hypothetical protein
MQPAPLIRTAIPQRRYRIGEYTATLLGEVDSGDAIDYRYILAFVEEGKDKPSLFVCSERNPPGQRAEGSHRLRLVKQTWSEVLGSDDAWRDLDQFADEALRIGIKLLNLQAEGLTRLL